MSDTQAGTGTSSVARDALIRSLIVYSVEMAALAVILALAHHRPWFEHQAWRVRQWRKRGQAREDAMVAELQRDIAAWEHGRTGS